MPCQDKCDTRPKIPLASFRMAWHPPGMAEKTKGKPPAVEVATVRISESLRAEAKALAAHQRRDLREVMDDAVRDYLKRQKGA
jgi:hypothetical protein